MAGKYRIEIFKTPCAKSPYFTIKESFVASSFRWFGDTVEPIQIYLASKNKHGSLPCSLPEISRVSPVTLVGSGINLFFHSHQRCAITISIFTQPVNLFSMIKNCTHGLRGTKARLKKSTN